MKDDSMKPKRIQRQRTKGWKMPPNTVSVCRPHTLGNPFVVGEPSGYMFKDNGDPTPMIASLTLEQCVEMFDELSRGVLTPEMHPRGHQWLERFRKRTGFISPTEYLRSQLRGKNVACYCNLDAQCHGDIILRIANES